MLVPFVREEVGLGLPGFNPPSEYLFRAEFSQAPNPQRQATAHLDWSALTAVCESL